MNDCILYLRVSTDSQDYTSQEESLRQYATALNYNVVNVFAEKVSGYSPDAERIQYEEMKDFVLENNIKNILVWELSRFSRSALRSLNEIEDFTKKGINIYFKKDNLNTLEGGLMNQMVITILSFMAEYERNTYIDRSIRGRRYSASQGKWSGLGVAPYGIERTKDGYIGINEEEAKWVIQMYEWRKEGKSTRWIANQLDSLGVETRNSKRGRKRTTVNGDISIQWGKNTITKILKSPLYKGERHYSGQVIKIPSIVNESLWDEVQNTFKENEGYFNKESKYKYLVKGKISCGCCGLSYLSRTDMRNGNPSSYYFCSGRKDKQIKCKNGQFSSKVIDRVTRFVFMGVPEFIDEYWDRKKESFDLDSKLSQIEYFKSQVEEKESLRKKLLGFFTKGLIQESEFEEQIGSANMSIKEFKSDIDKIENEIKVFNDGMNTEIELVGSKEDQEEVIKSMIERIKIWRISDFDFDKEVKRIKKLELKNRVGDKKDDYSNWKEPIPTNGNDKLGYMEIKLKGIDTPFKTVFSTVTDNIIVSHYLDINN
ncbi:recombinase family protein [Carboxylicivirga sp. RSCT41]|uniref:recombinase family protein n=1 Tax=Carboxylicivirga agarovorans TaxID=3417570 RepID=UPI003D328616